VATPDPPWDASGKVVRIPLDAQYCCKYLYVGAMMLYLFACLPLLVIFGLKPNPYFSLPLFLSGWYGLVCIAAGLVIYYYRYQRRPDYYGLQIDSIGAFTNKLSSRWLSTGGRIFLRSSWLTQVRIVIVLLRFGSTIEGCPDCFAWRYDSQQTQFMSYRQLESAS